MQTVQELKTVKGASATNLGDLSSAPGINDDMKELIDEQLTGFLKEAYEQACVIISSPRKEVTKIVSLLRRQLKNAKTARGLLENYTLESEPEIESSEKHVSDLHRSMMELSSQAGTYLNILKDSEKDRQEKAFGELVELSKVFIAQYESQG